jgi:hypothetical protein
MDENIALVVPTDAPKVTTFNLPTLEDQPLFGKMQAIADIATPTIVPLSEDEVTFLLNNLERFDVAIYLVDFLPDYDFTPKWVTFLPQLDTVSFDALSEIIGEYHREQATDRQDAEVGNHVVPVVDDQLDGEDGDVEIITPEQL